MKVLIAEDDEISRQVLAAQLRKLGYEVVEAVDGAAAWDEFNRSHPQILVTDWMMPNVDGPELCRRIRSVHHKGYTYIIILTALDRSIGYVEGMDAGADDFVTKPVEIAELLVRLRVAERIVRLQVERKQLEDLLAICPKCKRIRAADDRWEQVESYIGKRTDAQFSHGICPDCYSSIVRPQLDELKARRTG